MTTPAGPDDERWQETPPPVPYDQHEREMLQLIGERDRLEDIADRLAAAIAPPEVLGEHSSDNNPWRNALDYADTATQRRDAAPQQPPAQERVCTRDAEGQCRALCWADCSKLNRVAAAGQSAALPTVATGSPRNAT